jgi:hypothetical protein
MNPNIAAKTNAIKIATGSEIPCFVASQAGIAAPRETTPPIERSNSPAESAKTKPRVSSTVAAFWFAIQVTFCQVGKTSGNKKLNTKKRTNQATKIA